jgi:phage regulator Rha-like protein
MANLMSQIAISSSKHGGRRKLPFVFTEHGAIMAANVLNSKEAVQMSVFVVRAFIKLREILSTTRDLAAKIDELDRKVGTHDKVIGSIIAAIRQLTAPAAGKPRAIGFRPKRNGEKGSCVKLRS